MATYSSNHTTEFTFAVSNLQGELAKITTALGNAGINVEGIQSGINKGQGSISIVTSDPVQTPSILNNANITYYTTKEVFVGNFSNTPNVCGAMANALASNNNNIMTWFTTKNDQTIIGTSSDYTTTSSIVNELGFGS